MWVEEDSICFWGPKKPQRKQKQKKKRKEMQTISLNGDFSKIKNYVKYHLWTAFRCSVAYGYRARHLPFLIPFVHAQRGPVMSCWGAHGHFCSHKGHSSSSTSNNKRLSSWTSPEIGSQLTLLPYQIFILNTVFEMHSQMKFHKRSPNNETHRRPD